MKTPPISRRALIRLLAVLAALLMIASSCGDKEEEAVASEAVSAALEDDGSGDTSDGEAPSGDDGGEFCTAAADVDETLDNLDFVSLGPAELEASFTASRAKMQTALDLAPGDIKPAVETSAEAFNLMADELAAVEYSMLDLDLAVLDALDSDPKYEEANDQLDTYLFEVCGIGTDPALAADDVMEDDDTDTPVLEGTARDQIVAQLTAAGFTAEEAACLAEKPNLLEVMTSGDTATMMVAFEECGLPLERLLQLAPEG